MVLVLNSMNHKNLVLCGLTYIVCALFTFAQSDESRIFFALDNGRNHLLYVNQFDPDSNWIAKTGENPRRITLLDDFRLRISVRDGYQLFDTRDGRLIDHVKLFDGVQSVESLASGNLLFASMTDPNRSNEFTIATSDGDVIERIHYPRLREVRLAEVIDESGHFLFTAQDDSGYVVWEADAKGHIVWSAPLMGKGYLALRDDSGTTWATSGSRCTIQKIAPDGRTVYELGGRELFPDLGFNWFSGFSPTDRGYVVANWLGHGKNGSGVHLVEFSLENEVLWTWSDHELASQITNVLVLEPLDLR